MKVSELREADFNPRAMSQDQLLILKDNLASLGDLGGIVFNRRTGNLVGGHQRIKALKETVPETDIILEENFESPNAQGTVARGYVLHEGEKFSYREVDWDEATERIANIAANNIRGGWDVAKLSDLIQELTGLVDDTDSLKATGFSQEALEALTANSVALEQILRNEDVSRLAVEISQDLPEVEIVDDSLFDEKEMDENLPTNHICPKCGYKFN